MLIGIPHVPPPSAVKYWLYCILFLFFGSTYNLTHNLLGAEAATTFERQFRRLAQLRSGAVNVGVRQFRVDVDLPKDVELVLGVVRSSTDSFSPAVCAPLDHAEAFEESFVELQGHLPSMTRASSMIGKITTSK